MAAAASVAAVGSAGCWWKEAAQVTTPQAFRADREVGFWEATQSQFHRYWKQATATPESRLLWGIVGVNCGVYALWKITNPLTRLHFMYRHFTTTTIGLRRGRVHTLLTSSFSHMGAIHLGLNMYPLVHFGSVLLVTRRPRFFNPIDVIQLNVRATPPHRCPSPLAHAPSPRRPARSPAASSCTSTPSAPCSGRWSTPWSWRRSCQRVRGRARGRRPQPGLTHRFPRPACAQCRRWVRRTPCSPS